MERIIPAIIPQSYDHMRDMFSVIVPPAREVQIDIVGGGSVMLLRTFASAAVVEVDLMIESPEDALPLYIDAGVQKAVVHLESVTDIERIFAHHRAHQYQLGLSINNDTPLSFLTAIIENVDYVQLMGIKDIGTQGQPFDTRVLERITELKKQFPEIIVSIDGSVNETTLPQLRAAGADRFVSGSALFGSEHPHAQFEKLSALVS
jgi:ribulose-phosphate 3-epimerase